MRTIILLIISNVFMTVAWYGHLKMKGLLLWQAVLLGWGIAFFEYCLAVPANRLGYTNGWTGFQLKIMQEVIALIIFSFFAILFLKESFQWNYLISFLFILGAVYFAFKK